MTPKSLKRPGAVLFSLTLLASVAAMADASIDPKADAVLRRMSNFLAEQRQMTFRADGSTEVVLKDGQKQEFDHTSRVELKRPNKLKSERVGEKREAALYYDGSKITIFTEPSGYYATAPAPATIDEAIDDAREKLGLEAPGADLLYSNPYKVLTEDVVSGRYVGTSSVHDVPCDHLAFRGNETDWEIWVEQGSKPLPRKWVVVSKKVKNQPEFRVEMSEWKFPSRLDDPVFQFTPPPNAKRIAFRSEKPQ